MEISEGREAAALLDRFLKRLTIEPEEGSRLIRIGFTSTDPTKAALIANTLVDEYMKSQLETKTEGARHAAEWLEDRLAELGKTVRSLEQSVQQQRTEAGSNSIDIVSQRLAQINLQLIDAHATSAASRARYEQVRAVVERGGNLDALPEIINSPVIQALRAKHTELVGDAFGAPDDLWRKSSSDCLAARRDRRDRATAGQQHRQHSGRAAQPNGVRQDP